MKKKSGIYGIKINGKMYVGKTLNVNLRWIQHRSNLKRNKHVNPYLQNAYNKHNEVEFSIIEEAEYWLIEKEIMWMDKLKSKYPYGYNITDGGEQVMLGRKHTEEAKRKISKANRKPDYKERDKEVYDAFISAGSFVKAALLLPLSPSSVRGKVRRYEKENGLLPKNTLKKSLDKPSYNAYIYV